MQDKRWEQIDKYITEGNIEGLADKELAELCSTIDEIRALNPNMPGVDFAERITAYVAENQGTDGQEKLCNKKYSNWLKPMGWMSVAAAAVLLITMGVLPTHPKDQLSPVPLVQMTPSLNTPSELQAGTAPYVAAGSKDDKPDTLASTEKTVVRESGKATGSVQENKKGKQPSEGVQARNFAAIAPSYQTDRQSGDVNTVVQGRMKPAAQALVEESAIQASRKSSFRVLGIPGRTPVNVKVSENPPSITMTYKAGENEVIVRQWPQDVATAAKASQQQDRVIRITRENVVAEISGDVEREILEEFAQALQ